MRYSLGLCSLLLLLVAACATPVPRESRAYSYVAAHSETSLYNPITSAFARWFTRSKGQRSEEVSCSGIPHVLDSFDVVNLQEDYLQLLGHASVFIKMAGTSIITDPVFGDEIGPRWPVLSKRVAVPAVNLEDLPKIDVVLISHNHFDHMDIPSLKLLVERDDPQILVGLGNKHYLKAIGSSRIKELGWFDSVSVNNQVDVTFTPAAHYSNRGVADINHGLWGGFSIVHDTEHVFFAGDTGVGKHFSEISAKLGSPSIALLPIGAHQDGREQQDKVHLSPSAAIQAHRQLGAEKSLPIHHGTFMVGPNQACTAFSKLSRLVAMENSIGFIASPVGSIITI